MRLKEYEFKPNTYGLKDGTFSFKIKSTYADKTIESKTYTVQPKEGPIYERKAADLVVKALDLELSPELALPVWQEAMTKPNGIHYQELFRKFLIRNKQALSTAGQDVQLLLSQSR